MSNDLRDRLAAALSSAPTKLIHDNPEALAFHRAGLGDEVLSSRHDRHNYCATCALCRGETETLVDAVLAVVQPAMDRLAKYESAINWQASCLACSRVLDSSVAETERAEKAEAERDAALATLARVRRYAELMTDSVVVPVRGYGVDLVYMLDCDQEHATIAEQDTCPGPAGAGSTQDGA